MTDVIDIFNANKVDLEKIGRMESTYGLPHSQIFDDVLAEAKILSQKELKEKIRRKDYKSALIHILKSRDYSRAADIVENKYRAKYLNQNTKSAPQSNYSTKEEVKTNTINELVNI